MAKHRREGGPAKCRTSGHLWKKNMWTGSPNRNYDDPDWVEQPRYFNEIQHYHCERSCGSHRYELKNWDHEVSREERAKLIAGMNRSVRAMDWLLNYAEPDIEVKGAGY